MLLIWVLADGCEIYLQGVPDCNYIYKKMAGDRAPPSLLIAVGPGPTHDAQGHLDWKSAKSRKDVYMGVSKCWRPPLAEVFPRRRIGFRPRTSSAA